MLLTTLAALATPLERVAPDPARGPGAVRFRWDGVELRSLGAAVLTLEPGHPVPDALRREGVPLGSTERSWRVRCAPGEDALDTAARWQAHPAVRSAFPDAIVPRVATAFDDPDYGAQWYMPMLGFEDLFDVSPGDPDVRVAVLDGPIDIDHADLAAGVALPYDALADDDDPRPDCSPTGDCDTHGTSSAGIIAARANNGVDLVGLCSGCTLVPIQMLGEGSSIAADVLAFEHAIAADAGVINNSWGFAQAVAAPPPLADVIARARTEPRGGLGALVVFAAGNDDRELRPNEVTGLPGVLTVSATDRYGFPTNYTNTGSTISLAAPSATVTLQAGGGLNTLFGGTSAAAPVASGVAAWALSVRPDLSEAELYELLISTADPATAAGGHDPRFGWGHLDPAALLAALVPDPAEEAPRACGCDSGGRPAWLAGLGLLLLALRRR